MFELKDFYSAKELSLLSISGLPNSERRILDKARRENWQSRKRSGKGGGYEYELASMPTEIQQAIQRKFAVSVVQAKPKLPTVKAEKNLAHLTDKQRAIADARMGLVQYVLELEETMSRRKAVSYLCNLAKSGELPSHLAELVKRANAKGSANRTVSERSLMGWVVDFVKADSVEQRLKATAPAVRQVVSVEKLSWLSWFLGIYRQSNAMSVQECYRHFEAEWHQQYEAQPALLEAMPSLNQVRWALKKLPIHILQKGRLSGSHYKQLLAYVKRDWSLFKANDIWIGDGHSLKMKVKHPISGRPFTPELTMIVDGASRKVVGWSLAFSENTFAVLDALRHGITQHGTPAIYYSDNGGGETNKMLDAEVTGILHRFSIHHETGIAGNPQGRGIIERLNSTVGKRIAEQFATYYGKRADPEATRKMLSGQMALANRKAGKALTAKQLKAQQQLPTWDELLSVIEAVINWYNNEHIHSEIRCTPSQKYQRVRREEDIVMLSEVELRDIQRPHFIRTTNRALVEWHNHYYFHLDLLNYQGQEVIIAVDIHDPSYVQVRTKDGKFICNAGFEAHKKAAFPISFVEQKKQARAEAAIKRAMHKVDAANAELSPIITIEQQPDYSLLVKGKKQQKEPIFLLQADKEEYERKKRAVG